VCVCVGVLVCVCVGVCVSVVVLEAVSGAAQPPGYWLLCVAFSGSRVKWISPRGAMACHWCQLLVSPSRW